MMRKSVFDCLSFAVRLAMFGLAAACGAAVLYVLVSVGLTRLSPAGTGILIVLPLVTGIALLCAALRLPNGRLPHLVAEGCILGVAVLAIEVALAAFFPVVEDGISIRQNDARKRGIPFDARSRSEVVDDLRAQGKTAYPEYPVGWIAARPDMREYVKAPLYPLSNISNATIVACNESGKYLIFESDEYGFHNPKGIQTRERVQVAALGSSFVSGHCVNSDENMVARIREKYPQTLTFGMPMANMVTILGIFNEYVRPLKPRVVIWFVYAEDLWEDGEMKHPILKRYFEPGFRQHLRRRQDEVDALLGRALLPVLRNDDRRRAIEKEQLAASARSWRHALKLTQIRKRLLPATLAKSDAAVADFRPTMAALRLMRDAVASWGGKLYGVYIADYKEAVTDRPHVNLRMRDIAPVFEQVKVPLIDGLSPIRKDGDPARFYAMRRVNHFNPGGHQLLADIVVRRLRRDFGNGL